MSTWGIKAKKQTQSNSLYDIDRRPVNIIRHGSIVFDILDKKSQTILAYWAH